MTPPPGGAISLVPLGGSLVTGVPWVQLGCHLGVCSVYAIFSAF
jgi:hypothetical protein